MDVAMEDYRRALGRMAVMLFALAGLAERAAGRSRPLRGLVLWLLRPAEAAARAFVVEEMSGAPTAPMALRQGGDSPAEALRLASCLRALAAALDNLALRAGRLVVRLDAVATPAVSGPAPLCLGRPRSAGISPIESRAMAYDGRLRPLHHAARGPPPRFALSDSHIV